MLNVAVGTPDLTTIWDDRLWLTTLLRAVSSRKSKQRATGFSTKSSRFFDQELEVLG